jgi:hypothetical protein
LTNRVSCVILISERNEREEIKMVEVFGMMMEEKEYESMMSTLKVMWEAEEDKDYYDDFDEFIELKVHQFIYPEV